MPLYDPALKHTVSRDHKKLTPKQVQALRDIAATGDAGLPLELNGRVTINGNCWDALGSIYGRHACYIPLVEKKDHGFVRTVYTRGGGSWPLYDIRYHLTDEGRRILALLPAPKEDAR